MGYGLESYVPLLVNRDRHFDIVDQHYRSFDVEPGPFTGMDLYVDQSRHLRFGTFLELIQKLDQANSPTVLVVNHGLSDASDNPLGLVLPLSNNAPTWNVEEYTLGLLAKFVSVIPDDDRCEDEEKKSLMNGVRMPRGTLKPIGTALQNFRLKRQLKRLELRACNLGRNPNVMELLGMVLGVQVVVAPKVHMFYMGPGVPLPLPLSDSRFDDFVKRFPRARVFTDTAVPGPKVAIQINGQHSFRTMNFACTGFDIKWFIEKFICAGSGYVPTPPGPGARVASFTFSGADSAGSFFLPQEKGYESQLVEQAIPRVALTTTVERK
jgi:hypothetical protein